MSEREAVLLNEAILRDRDDELSAFREAFYLPETGIYMDGNSLGLLSRPAEQQLLRMLDEWKRLAIGGWLGGDPAWYYLPEQIAEKMAPFIGAEANEVIMANSTTVNLHQILATFYAPQGQRSKIVIDEFAFPTDVYSIQSHMRLHGLDPAQHLVTVPSRERLIEEDDVIAALDEHAGQVAMLVLPGVIFTTGQLFDLERLARAARERDVIFCVDGSHSVGSVQHHYDEWGVDCSIWCTYKYLNGGPGSVAGLYVNRQHLDRRPGLAGWYSSDKNAQFDMAHQPTFAQTAGKFQMGTPPLFGLVPLQASLDMFHEAGMDRLRARSLALTSYLMELLDSELAGQGFTIPTPRDDERRGGHVSLAHPEGAAINEALKRRGVVPDFRQPDMIRLSPIALYTSYEDVARVVLALVEIMRGEEHHKFDNTRRTVA